MIRPLLASTCLVLMLASALGHAGPSVYPTGTTVYDPARARSGFTVLSLLGGIIGILIGLSLAGLASSTMSIPFAPSAAVILLAVGFSGLIGMVFGFFPALRGARLDPIDALRHE